MERPLIEQDDEIEEEKQYKNVINRQNNEINTHDSNQKLTGYLVICMIVAGIGSTFHFGWSIGVYNVPSDVIKSFFNETYFQRYNESITTDQMNLFWSITNGLMPFGGIFGGLSSGFVCDSVGRKGALLLTNILVAISTSMSVSSKFIPSYETLIVARFISGLLSGLFSGILPIYLSELAPKNLRGSIGTLSQLLIVIGIVLANILGLPELLGTEKLWPVLVAVPFIPFVISIGLLAAVESPKHLFLNKNDSEGARRVLLKLRNGDTDIVDSEINELAEEQEQLSKQSEVKWVDFLKVPSLKRPIVVAVVLQISQQLSGINAVIFYSTDIFKSAGLEGQWPVYGTIAIGIIQLIMTFVCMLIVDKLGRRILLLVGMTGMSVFAFGLAIFRIVGTQNTDLKWLNYLTLVCAILYIIFFSIGPGAIPWLITAELFGSNAKGKAISVAVFINWMSNFLVTISFPFIEAQIGSYSFLIFGGLLVSFAVFVLLFVPETKQKTSDEIATLFSRQYLFFPKRE